MMIGVKGLTPAAVALDARHGAPSLDPGVARGRYAATDGKCDRFWEVGSDVNERADKYPLGTAAAPVEYPTTRKRRPSMKRNRRVYKLRPITQSTTPIRYSSDATGEFASRQHAKSSASAGTMYQSAPSKEPTKSGSPVQNVCSGRHESARRMTTLRSRR